MNDEKCFMCQDVAVSYIKHLDIFMCEKCGWYVDNVLTIDDVLDNMPPMRAKQLRDLLRETAT